MTTAGDAAARHIPVLRERSVEILVPALTAPGSVAVDATLGMGGHTEALLNAAPNARVIGLDRDRQALDLAARRLAPFGDRFVPVHAVYDDLDVVLEDLGLRCVQAILFDLGVSSLQLDEAERGFAYAQDAPLDMRMDQSTGVTAADLLATATAEELTRILRTYGEERFAGRIAASIVRRREVHPLTRTGELVDLVSGAVPAATRRTGGHPAKRTFQALRIAVNDELAVWERAIARAIDALAVGGRIVVLSYHSLEDRITKQALAHGATSRTPIGLPVELPEHAAYLRLLTRGAEEATAQEQEANRRSASVRLRAAERLTPSTGARR